MLVKYIHNCFKFSEEPLWEGLLYSCSLPVLAIFECRYAGTFILNPAVYGPETKGGFSLEEKQNRFAEQTMAVCGMCKPL